jgi:ferredoxin-NADP reductase
MQVVFDHHHDEANNITSFFFRPTKPFTYTAGQFIELHIDHNNPDNRGQKRWFTLSSSPTDELLSITTRIIPKSVGKRSTFKNALRKLQPGDLLTMSEPMGDFVLPKLIQTPLVFVAGGIGITPYHSILSWLAATNEKRPISLIYGVGSEDEIIFQDTFDKAHQHVTMVVKSPSSAWGGERGVLTPELIMGLAQPSEDALIYVSGPEPMVETLEKGLKKQGVSSQHLVLDFFPNYSSNY